MNIRDLEYVVALADHRHFGLASKVCHVSQPALSAQIRKLEEELGVVLFKRVSGDVIPTDDARFIIDTARTLIQKASEIRRYAHAVREGQQPQTISLGVIPTVAPYYLPEFFRSVASDKGSASIRWQILEERTQTLMQRLDEGRLDAALMVIPVSGIRHAFKKLFDEPLFLAVPKRHSLAKRPDVVPSDLREEEWLLLDDGHCLNVANLDICDRARNPSAQNSFRATSLETLRHMVASHSGITLMPDMARHKHDGIVYVPLRDGKKYTRAISLVWRKDNVNAPKIEAIAERLSNPLAKAVKGRAGSGSAA